MREKNLCQRCGKPTNNPKYCSRHCTILTVRNKNGRPPKPELDRERLPTKTEIAWATGFFEGDGNVINTQRSRQRYWCGLRVSVSQKGRWPLDILRICWGGSVLWHDTQNSWCWSICGKRATEFLGDVQPFLSPRRKAQIRRARYD